MLGAFVLGFACCWLFAGVWAVRYTLTPEDWSDIRAPADVVCVLIAIVIWPYLLPEYDHDA